MVSEGLRDQLKQSMNEFIQLRGTIVLDIDSIFKVQDCIIPYLQFFMELNFGDFTSEQADKINTILNELKSAFITLNKSIHIFKGTPDNSSDNIERDISSLETAFNKYKNELDSFYTFSLVNKLNKSLIGLTDLYSNISNEISSFENRVNTSIEGLQILAGEIALPVYTEVYENEASRLQKASVGWLIVGIVLIFLFICMIFKMMSLDIDLPVITGIEPIVLLLTFLSLRMTLILFSIFVIYFVIHKHNILKHNATLNKTKANALAAYRGFVETSKDEEARNIILLKITDLIFSASNTGYLKNEDVKDLLKDSNALLSTISNITNKK